MVQIRQQLSIEPMSVVEPSALSSMTYSDQVPFGSIPLNALRLVAYGPLGAGESNAAPVP